MEGHVNIPMPHFKMPPNAKGKFICPPHTVQKSHMGFTSTKKYGLLVAHTVIKKHFKFI
jgi:hypothetical protein